jgi:hypothetical protein
MMIPNYFQKQTKDLNALRSFTQFLCFVQTKWKWEGRFGSPLIRKESEALFYSLLLGRKQTY